ncbi:extensin family protein [Sphingomonas sp. 1P06PA]|uniref:extensin-like domain-containing protein n=1 Tax=Sphingomonas sp. 1P06PA TaxID=554121 RepID=UPI0039A51A05
MALVRLARFAIILLLIAVTIYLAWLWARDHPQDLPWTELDLSQPIGVFTGRKLTALTDAPAECKALLGRAGVRFTALPPLSARGGQCGYDDAVRVRGGGPISIDYAPPAAASCSVVAALSVWEWEVVQPAALRLLGQPVVRIDTFGSYNCRRIGGGREGGWSEHATADAIDIAGFRLKDGRRITIAGDWAGEPADAAFLRALRDGACDLFATVLSPDYNAAHRDHLHLDQANRGRSGWRGCR